MSAAIELQVRRWTLHTGDARAVLKALPAESAHCCFTSPPYWRLRDYGLPGQIGAEPTPQEYTEALVSVLEEVRRVLRPDGTIWLNLGDSYAGRGGGGQGPAGLRASRMTHRIQDKKAEGLKCKDLVGIPWRVALALQEAGWWLRCDVIWSKPNPIPESVRDRPSRSHEYLFLLSKSEIYYYDAGAVREPAVSANSRQLRSVWEIPTVPTRGEHPAPMPPALAERCLRLSCPIGGLVLDPFAGSGTTGLVALRLMRRFFGVELSPEYAALARRRLEADAPLLDLEAKWANQLGR